LRGSSPHPSGSGGQGEPNAEGRALADSAVDRDRAAVPVEQRPADRQTEPRPEGRGGARLPAVERPERPGKLAGGDGARRGRGRGPRADAATGGAASRVPRAGRPGVRGGVMLVGWWRSFRNGGAATPGGMRTARPGGGVSRSMVT